MTARRLAVILPFAAFAAACSAQGCYQFSGPGITLDINVAAITYTYGPIAGETVYNFSGTDSVTLNAATTMWSESGSQGSINIQYESIPGASSFTTFQMIVPNSGNTANWTVLLGGTGNLIPSLLLPSPQNLPPISAWMEVQNSNTITLGAGKTATTYNITSLGPCTSVPTGVTTTTTSGTPAITAVQDAGSYTGDIAQGSVFVVKGSNLSASGFKQESFPLPTTDQGVTINFAPSKGGTAIQPYLVYLYNENGVNQLAAILPSNTPTGNYKVTVTNGTTTSASVTAAVVKTKPALITQDSSGSGLAVVQNFVSATELDVNRFTTGSIAGGVLISPAHPGQTEIAWLTGMGGVTVGDNVASPGYNFATNGVSVQVIVGGVAIPASYAGRAPGLAGTDQINFTLPANTPTGCTVPFAVNEGGVLSKTTFISIAPSATATSCVLAGYTTAQLTALDNGSVIVGGGFNITEAVIGGVGIATSTTYSAQGGFLSYSGFEIAGAPVPGGAQNPTGCTVNTQTAGGVGTGLDAGAITLTGPSGSGLSNSPMNKSGTFLYTLPFQSMPPGMYTLHGAGGSAVGAFSASVVVPAALTITNFPSQISRSADLTLNYTGGDTGDVILVQGSTGVYATGLASSASFSCYFTVGSGSVTIPASIVGQLSPITAAEIANATGFGLLDVTWGMAPPNSAGIVAPLASGGTNNVGYFLGAKTLSFSVPYQ